MKIDETNEGRMSTDPLVPEAASGSETAPDVKTVDPEGKGPNITGTETGEITSVATIFSRIFPPNNMEGVFRPPLRNVSQIFEMVGMSEQTTRVGTLMNFCLWSPWLGDETSLVVRDPDWTTGPELLRHCMPMAPTGVSIEKLPGGKGKHSPPGLKAGCVYVVWDDKDPLWKDPSFLDADLETDVLGLKRRLIGEIQHTPIYNIDVVAVQQAVVKLLYESVIPVQVDIGEGVVKKPRADAEARGKKKKKKKNC